MSHSHYRHGDVLLSRVETPEGESVQHNGSYILAFGEVTGHKHVLRVKNPENLKVYKNGQTLYLMLMEVGTVTHEEHSLIEILPGTYKMDFEREYDYALESMRQSID